MPLKLPSFLLAVVSSTAAALAACGDHDAPASAGACELEPTQTFHERIEPLLSGDRVSTCNQCHLSGVDLSAFARETPCKTWACLVDQGLVDVEAPRESKILSWIERASPDSELITPDVISAEHDAFQDWIESNAACPSACAGVACGEPDAGPICQPPKDDPPSVPTESDTRGCSDLELEQAFLDDVYAWRGRCFPCHFDTETKADKLAPRWLSAVGNCQTGSAVSLKRVETLGLLDVNEPEHSLLLEKPLGTAGMPHGGGVKFTSEDEAYKSFLRFALHYQDCKRP